MKVFGPIILGLLGALAVVINSQRKHYRWLVCRCGHYMALHEHYRPGTDCGSCGPNGCSYFRNSGK